MKSWLKPEVEEIEIKETEYKWRGRYFDGGYVGDGIISGHHSNCPPDEPEEPLS